MTQPSLSRRSQQIASEKRQGEGSAGSAGGAQVQSASALTTSPGGSSGSIRRRPSRAASGKPGAGLGFPEAKIIYKVFWATKGRDRAVLGEKVTEWVQALPEGTEITGKWIRQSSDAEFHCLSVTLAARLP